MPSTGVLAAAGANNGVLFSQTRPGEGTYTAMLDQGLYGALLALPAPSRREIAAMSDSEWSALLSQYAAVISAVDAVRLTTESGLAMTGQGDSALADFNPAAYEAREYLHALSVANPSVRKAMLTDDYIERRPAGAESQELWDAAVQEANDRPAPPPPVVEPSRYIIGGVEVYADGTKVPGGYDESEDAARQIAAGGGVGAPSVGSHDSRDAASVAVADAEGLAVDVGGASTVGTPSTSVRTVGSVSSSSAVVAPESEGWTFGKIALFFAIAGLGLLALRSLRSRS